MLSESWITWEPISGLAPKYTFHKLIDGYQVFKIVLHDATNPTQQLIIDCWKSRVYFERTMPLTTRIKTISTLKKEHGDAFINEWTFFKVLNSCEKQRFIEQSYGVPTFEKLQHFVYLTTDSCIEILAFGDPVITVSNSATESID